MAHLVYRELRGCGSVADLRAGMVLAGAAAGPTGRQEAV